MASQRTFRLSEELDAWLEATAVADGRSVSNLIVRWLEAYKVAYEEAPAPPKQWESPGVSAQRMADEASRKGLKEQSVVGTPLPKIAPRKKR